MRKFAIFPARLRSVLNQPSCPASQLFLWLVHVVLSSAPFSLATTAQADEVVPSRWQVLPLAALFYASQTDQVVSAAFDLPCGAQPLGVLLIDQGRKLQVAALVARPLAACTRLPERRTIRMPFVDSTAYQLIEPLRGDLDGLRVEELHTVAASGLQGKPQLSVEVPCGVRPAGLVVMPGRPVGLRGGVDSRSLLPMNLVAIGFRESPRRALAECGAEPDSMPVPRQSAIVVGGLVAASVKVDSRSFAWQVLPRKVTDLRKLGVLDLRGIDRVEMLQGKTGQLGVVHFRRRCFEVPVGIALVPSGHSQAMAVAVARYINAPCLTRQAKIPDVAFEQDTISLINPRARALSPGELSKFRLGRLHLAPGTKGDVSGLVLTAPGQAFKGGEFPRGYFAFVARSTSPEGVFALRKAGITTIDTSNPVAVASRLAASAGFPRSATRGVPLRLQITSAL